MKTKNGGYGSLSFNCAEVAKEKKQEPEEEPPGKKRRAPISNILNLRTNVANIKSKSFNVISSNTSFPISHNSQAFLKKYYPDTSIVEWNDWKWQIRNRIRRIDIIEKMMTLTADEKASVIRRTANLPIAITPYYFSLLDPNNPDQPLRKTHLPVTGEFLKTPGEDSDPLS